MPKRSSVAHGGAQRQKPKVQKSVELVRPVTSKPEPRAEEQAPEVATRSATATATAEQVPAKATVETPKAGSASAQLAARRQTAAKRAQQRNASLITPEHFIYVRKDLIFIAILAVIMIVAIIVLYFIFGASA